jgi:hypothetical protein
MTFARVSNDEFIGTETNWNNIQRDTSVI